MMDTCYASWGKESFTGGGLVGARLLRPPWAASFETLNCPPLSGTFTGQ